MQKAIYLYGIDAEVTDRIDEANIILSVRSKSSHGSKVANMARTHKIPLHVIKSNTDS